MLSNVLGGQNSANAPPSLPSGLEIPEEALVGQQAPQGAVTVSKRRRKADDEAGGAEPRRLRRSHEACARCRSKKIKCDSKHPRCTACATAGTVCNQEDRHRQRLTPRGLTMRMEQLLAQCEALLKSHIPDFDMNRIEEYLVRQGIDPASVSAANLSPDFQVHDDSSPRPFQLDHGPPKPYPVPYPGPHIIPTYPPPVIHYSAYPPLPHIPGPPIYPPFHPPPAPYPPPPLPSSRLLAAKGTDPNGNDMSDAEKLAANFGVSPSTVSDLRLHVASDREDLAVDYNGLTSGRDRSCHESVKPRNPSSWLPLTIPRNGAITTALAFAPCSPTNFPPANVVVWLPKDRAMFKVIVDVYFKRLNIHRPIYTRKEFDSIVAGLYDQCAPVHDPGHICGVYLILALGTLSELNHRTVSLENKADISKSITPVAKDLMPPDWPSHDEFFERALAVKPDLRVSVSSLQALILLHWYLYTERQGRTLWRLVGSLVRLSIELGLHHDPSTQYIPSPQGAHLPQIPLFSEEECQLRIRLWGIVLVHDRGTSILLGRPLAIAPSDTDTPRPSRLKISKHHPAPDDDFSEHFELSHPVAEIQADIINSLYTPKKQAGDTVMRNATRIVKSLIEFRKHLPERYKYYFSGNKDLPLDKKVKLVQGITEDEGLTLLKLGIARILLLRALFSSKELNYASRHQALVDAIITSHNVIVIHNQLIRFPDIAFFTSPIPLHIAAMVILFGHMSQCEVLPHQTVLEDLWMALDMIPRFRWRWERKDAAGGHPLIARLVERVMSVDLHTIGPSSHPVLIPEPEWDEEGLNSPRSKANLAVISGSGAGPVISSPVSNTNATVHGHGSIAGPNAGAGGYGVIRGSLNGSAGPPGTNNHVGPSSAPGPATPPHKRLVDMPPNLFYPFFPEVQVSSDVLQGNGASSSSSSSQPSDGSGGGGGGGGPVGGGPATRVAVGRGHGDYSQILAAAAAAQESSCHQPGQNTFMSEERTPDPTPHQIPSPSQTLQMQTPGWNTATWRR